MFTFRRDVDENGVAELSKVFQTVHSAPHPNLMVDVSLKPIKRTLCTFLKVDLRCGKQIFFLSVCEILVLRSQVFQTIEQSPTCVGV